MLQHVPHDFDVENPRNVREPVDAGSQQRPDHVLERCVLRSEHGEFTLERSPPHDAQHFVRDGHVVEIRERGVNRLGLPAVVETQDTERGVAVSRTSGLGSQASGLGSRIPALTFADRGQLTPLRYSHCLIHKERSCVLLWGPIMGVSTSRRT